MDLKTINDKLYESWVEALYEENKNYDQNRIPYIFTLNFMGVRYFTFDDKNENLYKFYSIRQKPNSIVNDIYLANAKKCIPFIDENNEEYYVLEGELNLVVITSVSDTDAIMVKILRKYYDKINNI